MPLIVCPTPLGNERDLPPRVVDELSAAELVAAEDTRTAGALLKRLGLDKPLMSVHDHNEARRAPAIVDAVSEGRRVALVSEAGMPAINDPGYRVIRACIDAGLEVRVLPGPSSVLVAVVASGLPTDRWRFAGFVPRNATGRAELFASPETTVAFESPRRLRETLAALAATDPGRRVAVCRELTKVHEEVVRGTAADVAAEFARREPLGEIVLVVAGAEAGGDLGRAAGLLEGVVAAGAKPRPAAAALSEALGVAKNELYRAWLDRRG